MVKFNIGDRVIVTTQRFGMHQLGLVGTVYEVLTDRTSLFPVRVRFGEIHTNGYDHSDLAYAPAQVSITDPEFSLNEIHLGEDLINQMD